MTITPHGGRSLRARLAQAALAAAALVGTISVAQLAGSDAASLRPVPAAQVLERAPSAALPTAKFLAAAVAPKAEPAAAPATPDSAAVLAEHFQEKGYPVTSYLARTIASAAEKHGLPMRLAFGLVRTESGFSSKATSHVGAIGLTQLMPRTAAWLQPGTKTRDLRDPAKNVDIGFGYLRTLIDRYEGDVTLALLAYNRGPGTVDRILKKGGDPDNGYAKAVMSM